MRRYLALFPLLCASTSLAQKNDDTLAAWMTDSYESEFSEDITGVFGRSASGDFDANGVRDVVQIVGQDASVSFAPGELRASISLQRTTLNDVEVKRNGTGVADDVLYVDATALRRAQYNPTTRTFVQTNFGSAVWAGAKLVRDANPFAATTTGLIGVASNGTSLLLGATSTNGWTPAAPVNTGGTVRNIAALQWDGSGPNEIAVATTQGVKVYSSAGVQLAFYPGYMAENSIAVVRKTGVSQDRLAMVMTHTAPDSQFMGVAKWPSTGPQQLDEFLDLGVLGTCAITSADQDNDGDDDLFMSIRMAHVVMVLRNLRTNQLPAVTSFTVASQSYYGVLDQGSETTPAPDNQATATVTDLDGDGDLDVFFAVQSRDAARIVRGSTIDETGKRPFPTGIDGSLGAPSYSMDIAAPAGGPPAGATHLEINTWYGAGSLVTTTPAFQAFQSNYTSHIPLLPTQATQTVWLPYPNPGITAPTGLLGVRIRYVQRSPAGAIQQAWPSFVGMLANRDAEFAVIASWPYSGQPLTPPTDPESGGGFVPRPAIGPFVGGNPQS